LDGIDGDTTVSHGFAYLNELARTGRWLKLTREVNGVARHFHLSRWKVLRRFGWRDGLKPLVCEPLQKVWQRAPVSLRSAWRTLRWRNGAAGNVNPIINRAFAGRIGIPERLKVLENGEASPPRTAREEHARRLGWGIIPFVLEVADRAAAAFSLEPRYPFFDRRLVDFCLALPPEQKLHHGWTRIVLRRAMNGILPPEIQWRGGKSNLTPNFTRGLQTLSRQLVEDVIHRDPETIKEYVDLTALREAYHRYLSRASRHDEHRVWNAVTLALWLRRTGLAP
jgi:asparagine synthase (glutamine-hydrolysing)